MRDARLWRWPSSAAWRSAGVARAFLRILRQRKFQVFGLGFRARQWEIVERLQSGYFGPLGFCYFERSEGSLSNACTKHYLRQTRNSSSFHSMKLQEPVPRLR